MSAEWAPFGIDHREFDDAAASGQRILNVSFRRPKGAPEDESTADPAARWLRSALIGLGVLAAAAAAVSFAAQFQLVYTAKGVTWAAALEAAIPDAGSMVFASLGIALAIKGKRAVRARALNVACVALSLGMNALAAKSGWRNMAVWVMPSAVYALASDTLIGVTRAYALAKLGKTGDDRTMLDVFGQAALYLLRFTLATPSTAAGLRKWLLNATPLPDTSSAAISPAVPDAPALTAALETPSRPLSKTARFLALVEDKHGPLAGIDLADVSPIASDLAPQVSLDVGAARAALRPRVLAAQGGAR